MTEAELREIALRWDPHGVGWWPRDPRAAWSDIERLVAEVRRLRRALGLALDRAQCRA